MNETPEPRSHTMLAVRSRDTGPKMIVLRVLHARQQ
jgi:DNA mismatch endonuclease (patch repair protein)